MGKENLEDARLEMENLRIQEKKNQLNIELHRYKQDCRKRALDLALSDANTPKINSEGNSVVEKVDILKLAAEYYNWLISIPEK